VTRDLPGRRTLGNTLKYVFIGTSANFGNMFSMAAASLILPYLPMCPADPADHFLTDLPEMTIATDHVDDYYVGTPSPLGHRLHPALYDDLWAAELGVRPGHLRRAAVGRR
jgi:hypothetical protein